MASIMSEDFLLTNRISQRLYHDYAKEVPIIDYHCHLDPKQMALNHNFSNLTALWLEGDHYKWRAMRLLGVEEKYITGDASDYEKFCAWARVVPFTLGNPLYHWTHLEMKRYFDIDEEVNENSSEAIWNSVNEQLNQKDFKPQQLIEKSNVEMIGTTDDPLDDLKYHKILQKDQGLKAEVRPSFRPDPLLEIRKEGFLDYVQQLEEKGTEITSFKQFLLAVSERVNYFHEAGCRIADHGFEELPYETGTYEEISRIFLKRMAGQEVTKVEEDQFKTYLLIYLGATYHSLNWVMQLHIGALRNNNNRKFLEVGANTGFDSIHDFPVARQLNSLLNDLDKENILPKTIIYSLNPAHNKVIASAAGNFPGNGIKGKVQLGAAWWFNDHKHGIVSQLTDLSNIGLLSSFVGMLTDSRSFLSFTRHEYFRRVLCQLVGQWVENGEMPEDYDSLGVMLQNICYWNAKHYFELSKSLTNEKRV